MQLCKSSVRQPLNNGSRYVLQHPDRQTAGNGCVYVWPNKALIVLVLATCNKIIL